MKYDSGIYTVYKGETIAVDIQQSASLGAGQVVASLDGQTITRPISFKVTRNVGQLHQLSVIYYFVLATDGEYTVTLTGDAPGSDTIVRKVRAPQPDNHTKVNYLFEVVAKS